MIEIKEVDIEEAMKVHSKILEFNDLDPKKEYFENRYKNKDKLIIVAYYNDIPAGYIIGYDKFQDNESFYCWMAGVNINYRRLGILTQLMQYLMNWTSQRGYNILKIKTRNNRREMLSFLVKNGFYFTNIEDSQMEETNNIKELVQTMKDIRDCLVQLVDTQEKQEEISFISRKDIKSIFNCTDTTVAKMFNREDFPVIMIGEHKIKKQP